jgi:hypothetical protein
MKSIFDCIQELIKNECLQILLNNSRHKKNEKIDVLRSLFIIEKFCSSFVEVKKYKIHYSSAFNRDNLDENTEDNLNKIIEFLENGENINDKALSFIPKSSNFLLDKNSVVIADFANNFFGIKHLHIDGHNTKLDRLLYYFIKDNNFYVLKIAGHDDLYSDKIIKIIIDEYPDNLDYLGIKSLPDMPFEEYVNQSTTYVKDEWINGRNISYTINEKYYTSINLQTYSRINTKIIYELSNIKYKCDAFQDAILDNSDNYNFKILEINSGVVTIGNEISKEAYELDFPYLNDRLRMLYENK